MNVILNNKLIAEFIQAEKQDDDLYTYNGLSYYLQEMHRDWNFLMVAVDKIENIEFQPKNSTCIGFDTFGVEINKERCDITRYGDFTSSLLQGNGKTRIESVYNAVVLFIQWYNEQK